MSWIPHSISDLGYSSNLDPEEVSFVLNPDYAGILGDESRPLYHHGNKGLPRLSYASSADHRDSLDQLQRHSSGELFSDAVYQPSHSEISHRLSYQSPPSYDMGPIYSEVRDRNTPHSAQYGRQPAGWDAVVRDMSNRQMLGRQMSDRRMSDRQMQGRQMSDMQMQDRQMSDRQMSGVEPLYSRPHARPQGWSPDHRPTSGMHRLYDNPVYEDHSV